MGIPSRHLSGGSDDESLKELIGEVRSLREQVAKLIDVVSARDARIAELEKLLEDSRRSGKRQAAPFSKGQPKDEPARPGRKPGDAHGRHGHRMAPLDSDRTVKVPLRAYCPHCGGDVELDRVAEQFQTDLPALPPPATTRFKVAVGHCSSCGRRVQGRHGEQTSDALGAAGAQIGPSVKAWAAWLHYSMGLSFDKVAKLFAERFGLSVTAGALCQAAQSTSTDLVPVVTEIARRLNTSPIVAMDETGWRVNGEHAWLWVATNADVTFYDVAYGRGFDQATDIIDEDFDGTTVRDGWAPYRRYTKATHQTCLAHLCRRADEMMVGLPAWARGTPREVKSILGEALDARDPTQRLPSISPGRRACGAGWRSESGKSVLQADQPLDVPPIERLTTWPRTVPGDESARPSREESVGARRQMQAPGPEWASNLDDRRALQRPVDWMGCRHNRDRRSDGSPREEIHRAPGRILLGINFVLGRRRMLQRVGVQPPEAPVTTPGTSVQPRGRSTWWDLPKSAYAVSATPMRLTGRHTTRKTRFMLARYVAS
ncbi:MAG: IS66 family transposase [Acidimicrobiales bacterium]